MYLIPRSQGRAAVQTQVAVCARRVGRDPSRVCDSWAAGVVLAVRGQNEVPPREWLPLTRVLDPTGPRKTCPGSLLTSSSERWSCRSGTTPSPAGRPGGPAVRKMRLLWKGAQRVCVPWAWLRSGSASLSLGLGLSEREGSVWRVQGAPPFCPVTVTAEAAWCCHPCHVPGHLCLPDAWGPREGRAPGLGNPVFAMAWAPSDPLMVWNPAPRGQRVRVRVLRKVPAEEQRSGRPRPGCTVRKESPSLAGGREASRCVLSCPLGVRSSLPTPWGQRCSVVSLCPDTTPQGKRLVPQAAPIPHLGRESWLPRLPVLWPWLSPHPFADLLE